MEPAYPDIGFLQELERKLTPHPPLDWSYGGEGVIQNIMERMSGDEDFTVRLLNKILELRPHVPAASQLAEILTSPGSAWEVIGLGDEEFRLARRAGGPVDDALAEVGEFSKPAQAHLAVSLKALSSVEPDPSKAFAEAVKAVEAAAKPIVTPNDRLATLGKIISALKDRPDKWTVALPEESVQDVVRRMEVLWKSHRDRHGRAPPPT